MKVNTLVVIAANRGPYPAEDLVAAAKWSCVGTQHTVVVDVGNTIKQRSHEGYTLLRSEGEGQLGFHRANGVHWAIEQGIKFKQVCLLTDETMIVGRGIDEWAAEHLAKTGIGLLGVESRDTYEDAYARCAPLLAEWNLPVDEWGETTKRTLHGDVLFMPSDTATILYQNGALCPAGCEKWPIPYGAFISWAAMAYGYYQVGWGSQERQLPPLYVGVGKDQPSPHILSNRFLLYHSARAVGGFSEEEVRDAYKLTRGEAVTRAVQPVKPVVAGRGIGEVPAAT